jgi:hypothetical protein
MFVPVTPETALQDFIGDVDEKHQPIICLDNDGRPTAAFTVLDAIRYISERANELEGMIALGEHTVAHLLDAIDIPPRWAQMVETSPFGLAVKELQKPRIQILVGTDPATGKATGAILRAHRRY